jgi:hypothetical protein
MTRIIVGEADPAGRLARTLADDRTTRIWSSDPRAEGEAPDSSAPLARDLARFEADALERRPESVLLADSSDASLAAALVAAKLLIPLAATEAAMGRSSANARLIAQLADAYTRAP